MPEAVLHMLIKKERERERKRERERSITIDLLTSFHAFVLRHVTRHVTTLLKTSSCFWRRCEEFGRTYVSYW